MFLIFPNNINKRLQALLAGSLLCLCSLAVMARDYKVELLIFENLSPGRAYEPHNYQAPEEMTSNGETWALEPTMLVEAAETIKRSANYRLLQHYSWGQESLPYYQSAAYPVIEQNINGWVKVYANQLLFANIDIDYNGYRMNEKRRLKLDEKHFFDHPKFGVLLQVSRLEEAPDADQTNEVEPTTLLDSQ